VRFETSLELRLFADSVRGALGSWEPPRECVFGTWWDEHDVDLARRVAAVGWGELWADGDLLDACVAGSIELGRVLAPLSLLDAATLGGALAVGDRARHLVFQEHKVALVTRDGLVLGVAEPGRREPTFDGTGTVRIELPSSAPAPDGGARLRAWSAATLGYLAGVAAASLAGTVAHVSSREQFGEPLASLPTMQARLADAALAVAGLELVAWESAVTALGTADEGADPLPREALRFGSAAAREVTAMAQQAHGAMGFALESGVHRAYRRVKSTQVWIAAVLDAGA